MAFPETTTDDQFLGLFSEGSIPSKIRTATDPGRPEFRRTVFSNKVSRFILPFLVFFFCLLPSPGQLRDVKARLGIENFGLTVDIWQTLQKSGVFFNELRAEDRVYQFLPPTEFTDLLVFHSYDIKDVKCFADSARALIRPDPMSSDFFDQALPGRNLEDAFGQREHPVIPN